MRHRLLRAGSLWLACLFSFAAISISARAQAPHWTGAQVERLIQWLEYARDDALNIAASDIPALRKAQSTGDGTQLDTIATGSAHKLLRAFYDGCCAASLRTGWHITGDAPPVDRHNQIADALAHDRLDQLFIDAVPHHPFYRAMRRSYAKETDSARRATLAANMDRWRWMPRALGDRYLLVNTAAYEAMLWENGKLTGRWKVVVGKTKSPTPVFSAQVTGVVLNPWWEIPPSIAAEGVAAMVRHNPVTAAKRGYVLENGRYRQRPGPHNSLGRMKLVMPNPYSVYLHDTPAQTLFGREVRTFSHGCVRVGDALGLAAALLARTNGWDRPRIDAVVSSGETRLVPLDQAIPVYITYFTAEPDDDGTMRFFPDVYNRDKAAVAPDDGKPCGL